MGQSVATSLRYLPPLMAGLLLGIAGWQGAGYSAPGSLEFQPQLVVRPAQTEVVTTRGRAPTADQTLAGRFVFEQAGFGLELRREGWPPTKFDVDEARGMTTARANLPRATLSVSVKGDASAEATLVALPKKTDITTVQGQARMDAGRHELLVQADGYLPKRLSVDLKPGERKEVTVDLQAIPGLPPEGFPFPSVPAQQPPARIPAPPSYPAAPAYTPPRYVPPPPRYQAPPPAYRPPAPVPRFTPIAPPPQPPGPDPVPMFTPIGN